MNLTIWKKSLVEPNDIMDIEVPEGSEFLCAREQFERICVWFRCDPNAPLESRRIAIVGTGHPAPSEQDSRYLGSASLRGGQLIFHVFERLVRP